MNTPCSIYLGGTFYQFSAAQVVARQNELQKLLHPSITVLKPKHADGYPAELTTHRDTTLTMRDKHLVKQSHVVVLDLTDCVQPPRGILVELGWATAYDIPVLLIIAPTSPFKFNMLNTLITWEVETYAEAATILNAMLT